MSGIAKSIQSIGIRPVAVIKPASADILQQNIKIAEDVLREFREELGYPRSYTFACQIGYNGDTRTYSVLKKVIGQRISEYDDLIYKNLRRISDYDLNADTLAFNMKELNAGNCYEQSAIVHNKLLERNINAVTVITDIKNWDKKRLFKDHWFVVFGFDKISDLWKEPKHWGKNTVVVDPWADISGSALEWEKKIHIFLSVKQYEKIITTGLRELPF